MKINLPIDWIRGYLRYGHFEGEIDINPEEEKEFKELLKKEIHNENLSEEESDKLEGYKDWIKEECSIVIDDYRIEEWGDIGWDVLL